MNEASDYTKIALFPQSKTEAVAAKCQKILPVKKTLKHHCVFVIPLAIIINIKYYWLCSDSTTPSDEYYL